MPGEPRPGLPRERGRGCTKAGPQSLGGGDVASGTAAPPPPLAPLAPRSNRCSEQAPHFPASACSGAFFLFLKCPKPRESREAYASSIVIILQERSGQGS